MEKTKLIIHNVVFLEPVTALTDFIIAALCLYFIVKLINTEQTSLRNRLWIRFFASVAFSSFLGGIAHLLFFYLKGNIHLTIWLSMNVAASVAVYFAELSAIELLIVHHKRWYKSFALLLLLTFTYFSLIEQNFNVAKINMGIGLLFVLISHILTSRKGIEGSLFVVSGISMAFIPVIIHSIKWSIHKWFNFNDISHVFMMGSLYMIFRGASQFNKNEIKARLENSPQLNHANT